MEQFLAQKDGPEMATGRLTGQVVLLFYQGPILQHPAVGRCATAEL